MPKVFTVGTVESGRRVFRPARIEVIARARRERFHAGARRLTPVSPWSATGRCTVLDDERAVQVVHDAAWVDGWVMAQRRDPDGWWALVRYSTGVG